MPAEPLCSASSAQGAALWVSGLLLLALFERPQVRRPFVTPSHRRTMAQRQRNAKHPSDVRMAARATKGSGMTQTARAEQARVSRQTVARYDALADVSVGAWRGKRSNGGRRRALSLHHMQMLLAWHLAHPDASAHLDEVRDIFVVTVGIRSVPCHWCTFTDLYHAMPCHAVTKAGTTWRTGHNFS